jgi:hypothetical protein
MNHTIMEATRAMLHSSGLPFLFWMRALKAAVQLRNRSPTKALTDVTPYQVQRSDKPDLSYLRVFGCRAYKYLYKTKSSKLHARFLPVIFVGYATEAKRGSCKTRQQERNTRRVTWPSMRVLQDAHCSPCRM